jgi:hypothetical protein
MTMTRAEWEDKLALKRAEMSAAWFARNIREWSALDAELHDLVAYFEKRFPAESNDVRGTTEHPKPLSKPELEKWFNDRIKLGQAKTSEREDIAAFKAQFGGHKYNRPWFREIRRRVVPKDWLKPGPNGPRKIAPK